MYSQGQQRVAKLSVIEPGSSVPSRILSAGKELRKDWRHKPGYIFSYKPGVTFSATNQVIFLATNQVTFLATNQIIFLAMPVAQHLTPSVTRSVGVS